jgi:hypothetical protein
MLSGIDKNLSNTNEEKLDVDVKFPALRNRCPCKIDREITGRGNIKSTPNA